MGSLDGGRLEGILDGAYGASARHGYGETSGANRGAIQVDSLKGALADDLADAQWLSFLSCVARYSSTSQLCISLAFDFFCVCGCAPCACRCDLMSVCVCVC